MSCGDTTRVRYPDESGYAERDDAVRLYYELFERAEDGPGDGLTVLLVPPVTFASQIANWRAQLPYIARRWRTIAFDGRGNGQSDRPRERTAYSVDQLVGDALAVLDVTGTARAAIVSLGPRAIVGLRLGVDHPDRVAGNIFLAPDLWAQEYFTRPFRKGRLDKYEDWDVFNPHYITENWEGFLRAWAAKVFPHPHSTRGFDEFIRYGLQTDGETFVLSLIGLKLPDRETALSMASQLEPPVFVVQYGRGITPPDTSGPLAEAAGAPLVTLHGLGPAVGGRWPVAENLVLRGLIERIGRTCASPVAP